MEIREIKNKDAWEEFLLGIQQKTFLQSWNWGEFNKKMGNNLWRFGIFNNSEIVGTTLVFKVQAKRGTFLCMPHGPNIKLEHQKKRAEILGELLNYLKYLAQEEQAVFIRVAPIWERSKENIAIFRTLGFRQGPIHIHPELTWCLNIVPTEDSLLMDMRKTTRYLVRKAGGDKNIEISQSQDLAGLRDFAALYQKTASRHIFVPFSPGYLKNEFSSFSPDDQLSIFSGRYRGKLLVSAIIIFWQGIAFYHHGASMVSKAPVSYGVQWEIIQEAKKRNCQIYNFWGVAPTESKKHPWWGLSLFKKGFGGYGQEYVKTQDFILSPRYWFNFGIEKVRSIKRGF